MLLDAENSKKSRGHAHGKAILVGEHAVVYGAEALAIPVKTLCFDISLQNFSSTRFTIGSEDFTEQLAALVEEAQVMFDLPDQRFHVHGETNIPLGAGLGSSAALSLAVLRAFSDLSGKKLDAKELARLGNILEARFHGTPSGVDACVVAYDTPILFRRGEGAFALNLAGPFPGKFILLNSGEHASTRKMVEKARPYFTSDSGSQIIKHFNAIAREASYGLQTSNLTSVASAMTASHGHLMEAGVVSAKQAELIQMVMDHGALAAKITGAGGGGSVLALCAIDWNEKEKLQQQTGQNLVEIAL